MFVCAYDAGRLVHEEALSTLDLELIFGPASKVGRQWWRRGGWALHWRCWGCAARWLSVLCHKAASNKEIVSGHVKPPPPAGGRGVFPYVGVFP